MPLKTLGPIGLGPSGRGLNHHTPSPLTHAQCMFHFKNLWLPQSLWHKGKKIFGTGARPYIVLFFGRENCKINQPRSNSFWQVEFQCRDSGSGDSPSLYCLHKENDPKKYFWFSLTLSIVSLAILSVFRLRKSSATSSLLSAWKWGKNYISLFRKF